MSFINLLVGLPIMLLCLIIQTATAFWSMRHFALHSVHLHEHAGFFSSTLPLLRVMVLMTLGNFVQITLWGVVFYTLGEFNELYEAIYHSTVNFASLGYGDIVMSKHWKMLGALEAVNGVLMLGMSSAALVAILSQLIKAQRWELKHDK